MDLIQKSNVFSLFSVPLKYLFPKSLVGVHVKTGKQYACKIVHKNVLIQSKKFSERLQKEFCILQKLDHPNIVKYVDKVETETELMLVMEFAPGGDLFDKIVE